MLQKIKNIDLILKGCLLYAVAQFISVFINVFIKKSIIEYNIPSWEVVAISQGTIVLLLIPLMIKSKFHFFNSKTIKLNLIRNILYAISLYLMYSTLSKLPVNINISVQFLVPIVASIFAYIFLKEKGHFIMWLSLFICIFGAYTIKHPDFSNQTEKTAYLMLFAFVLVRGITTILNGKLASKFDTKILVFYSHIIMFSVSLLFCWQFILLPFKAVAILSALGILCCFEYILIYKANKYCTVLTLQPIEFSKMVYSIILSSMVLGEMTTRNQIIGSIFIAIGFMFMILGKSKIERKVVEI